MRLGEGDLSGLEALLEEVRAMSPHLRAVEAMRNHDGITAAQRDVLEYLYLHGDQRAPGIARARGVSRQHILAVVTSLIRLELVDVRFNPAHQRSSYVNLSEAGRKRFEAIRRSEHGVLARIELPVSGERLSQAADTLRLVRGALSAFREAPRRRASVGKARRRR
jgi:DNA-binding MarR family transcriptional regulator